MLHPVGGLPGDAAEVEGVGARCATANAPASSGQRVRPTLSMTPGRDR
ncbi:hypothetical protein [Paractinoplanes durhamensis]